MSIYDSPYMDEIYSEPYMETIYAYPYNFCIGNRRQPTPRPIQFTVSGVGHLVLEEIEEERRRAHANAQTVLLEASRQARVRENVEAFKRAEIRKLRVGTMTACIIVGANFGLPAIYRVVEHLDEMFLGR